jgi:hypothetical protein
VVTSAAEEVVVKVELLIVGVETLQCCYNDNMHFVGSI